MTTKHQGPSQACRQSMSLLDVIRNFDTEEKAEAWFVGQRWPDGIVCSHCEGDNIANIKTREPQPWRYRTCRKHFSVKTKTVMHSANIPLRQWAIAIYLYLTSLKGVSSMKLHRDFGITQRSAWYMGHRLREMWDAEQTKFDGPVEADETYIGGKEANKHES